MDIKKWLELNNEDIIQKRRFFHANPELTHREQGTTKAIRTFLDKHRIKYLAPEDNITIAVVKGKDKGETIGIRCDIDALAVKEETGLPFSSKSEGFMHACGHDAHITMGLFCAKYLNENNNSFSGTVKVIFQPAEEGGLGAEEVIRTGLVDDCKAFTCVHVWPLLDTGKIALSNGYVCASVDKLKITVLGKGGHAAYPELCNDAGLAVSHIAVALQHIASRCISAIDSAVLSLCKIDAGSTWNVIAERAMIEGTFRTFSDETRDRLLKEIENTVKNIASIHRCKAELYAENAGKSVYNDELLSKQLAKIAKTVFKDENVLIQTPSMIGDDFSCYRKIAPSCYAFLGAHKKDEPIYPLHHCKFTIDEDVLLMGTEWFINASLCLLGDKL